MVTNKANNTGKDEMWVVTSEPMTTRGGSRQLKQVKVEELTMNINLFVEQLGSMLATTPEMVGKFRFEEFEVYAEITGKGTVAILGTGGEVGATGGLRFVFRRSSTPDGG
ncbi:MAG TPA: hypothetical protein VFA41_07690 [Ktedonobacteraceae bacterium]|jgi:hypothetical protein|nr:hypothetical protein [Ktedonobacteraceae bacterium]